MLGVLLKHGGKLQFVHHSQITYIALSNTGKIHTNRGSGGLIRLWLPQIAPKGIEFTFVITEQYELRIDPQDRTIFADNDALDGRYYGASDVGSVLRVCADENGDWIVIAKSGTWTMQES